MFTPISLTAQRNGGKAVKEMPSDPCCRSRVNCPLKGDKTHHRKIGVSNPDRHRSGRRRFFVGIICSDNYYIPLKFPKVNKNLSKNDKFFDYSKNFSQKRNGFDLFLQVSF